MLLNLKMLLNVEHTDWHRLRVENSHPNVWISLGFEFYQRVTFRVSEIKQKYHKQ